VFVEKGKHGLPEVKNRFQEKGASFPGNSKKREADMPCEERTESNTIEEGPPYYLTHSGSQKHGKRDYADRVITGERERPGKKHHDSNLRRDSRKEAGPELKVSF